MPRPHAHPGWTCTAAQSLNEVLDAWGLVYTMYLASGLIDPNEDRVHATRAHIGPQSTVATGYVGPILAWTATAIMDTGTLPLDRIFKPELDELRRMGPVAEFGMFASKCGEHKDSGINQITMMGYLYHLAIGLGAKRLVVGTHPGHVTFWEKGAGARMMGGPKPMPTVHDSPCHLMVLDVDHAKEVASKHRILDHWHNMPVPRSWGLCRYRFPEHEIVNSPLLRFTGTANANT